MCLKLFMLDILVFMYVLILFQIPDPSHVLSSVAIAFTSPVVTHIPVTFTLSNFPDVVSSLSWDFGDGAKRNNATVATVSHTYFYPGSFPLRVELCGSRVCRTVQIVVKVDSPNMQADLTCPVLSNISSKISLNTSVSNSYGSTVRWSRTSSDGTLYGNDKKWKLCCKTKSSNVLCNGAS